MMFVRSCFPLVLLLMGSLIATAQKDDNPTALLRGPYLQVASPTSITIRWRTDPATTSRVQYGDGQLKEDTALTTEHIVRLTGLRPHTRYSYTIGDLTKVLQGDTSNYFYTLPETGKAGIYRIGVFGDCGNNSVNQRNIKQSVLKYLGENYMDAWLLLGDNAYENGTDAEYQSKFFNIYKDDLLKQNPVFPSPGNHDYSNQMFPGAEKMAERISKMAYYKNFSMPTHGESGGIASNTPAFYSFDIGNIHFLSLNSYPQEAEQYRLFDTLSQQVQWIKRDLKANKNKQWIIAYWHHPPYTMGSHSSDENKELILIRENFIRILERNGVDLVLCGHSHDYERSGLMKGHYGKENTFSAVKHNLSTSSGLYDGSDSSCPYVKDASHGGTVYVVTGSSGKLGGTQPAFPHNAMQYSNATEGGASLLEVQGNRLDLKWICADGVIRDHFTMMKNVNQRKVIKAKAGTKVTLTASFIGDYKWSDQDQTTQSITVVPNAGTTTYDVQDKESCIKDSFTIIATK
ncbi:3',5'-cyclic AMP phosphodiesterase CpdA [Chitinophaga sp. CF118]|uniref:purple acid phosphatase family protein n=1 Tax=Chitinophaga sp. CF118 TaxID=1884367 RepID=UPI0008E43C92|nr:metallophosphoesterase family protein [Chitinophaga sp. CF118]SFF00624.1 3',5'-cyclic AMP phosphodiesterase CpdA [Chitinophaga sp. CF118]